MGRALLDPALTLTIEGLWSTAALGGFETDTLEVPRENTLNATKGREEMAAGMCGGGHAGAGDTDGDFGEAEGKLGSEEGVRERRCTLRYL